MNEQSDRNAFNNIQWKVAEEFEDEDTGVVIVVMQHTQPSHDGIPPRILYSWKIMNRNWDGKLIPYFKIITDVKGEKVIRKNHFDLNVFTNLITEAQYWIDAQLQNNLNEIIEARQLRETRAKKPELYKRR